MAGGVDRRSGPSRLTALPLLVGLGLAYGFAEFARQRWIAPSPPGLPGDGGGDAVAYLALGAAVVGLPALVVLLLRSWSPRSGRFVAGVAGLTPTFAVALGRIAVVRGWLWTADEVGELRWAVIVPVALLAAIVVAAILSLVPWNPRRRWARVAAVVALLAPLVLWWRLEAARPDPIVATQRPLDSRPNVVLLTIDTLRADALDPRIGGWPRPEIALRAATTAWSPSSWTRPAMASLFSGVVPTGHGADVDRAPSPDVAWWIEDLQRSGYRTLAVASNPHLRRRFGFDRGFDHFEHGGEVEWLEPVARSFWADWWQDLNSGFAHLETADSMIPRAQTVLREQAGDGPWLLWVHLIDPHAPYHLRGAGGAETDPDPGEWIDVLRAEMDGPRFRDVRGARAGRAVTTPQAREALRRLYAREVDYAMHWSARLLDVAGQLSAERDLVWMITSDHGEEFWDDGGFEHGHTLHASVTAVPMWVGGTLDVETAPTRLIDVGPWLLDLLDVDATDPLTGTGLLDTDFALAPFAIGTAHGQRDWLGEGMLYGPPRTRVRWKDGIELERDDADRTVEVVSAGVDTLGVRERSLLTQLDLWRERNAMQGRSVEVSPDLLRQLRALGYVQ